MSTISRGDFSPQLHFFCDTIIKLLLLLLLLLLLTDDVEIQFVAFYFFLYYRRDTTQSMCYLINFIVKYDFEIGCNADSRIIFEIEKLRNYTPQHDFSASFKPGEI